MSAIKTADTFDSRFEALEKDPVFLRKRRATLLCFSIRMFLLGAEYAIILPSIWLYLKKFDSQTWFLGLVVAVYPLAAVLSMPIVGRFYDRTKRAKEAILVLNFFEIAGNIVYALPYSQWLPFFGRFFAGLGDGFYSVANSELVFTYRSSERTSVYAMMEVGRVLGLTIGPAFNFFLQKVDFSIGSWRIDFGTSPGLLMTLFWILMQVLTVFFTSNLARTIEERSKYFPNIKLDTRVPPTDYMIDNKRVRETSLCESVLDLHVGDTDPLLANGRQNYYETIAEIEEDDTFHCSLAESNKAPEKGSLMYIVRELCTIEIMVLFYCDLALWLSQTELEVLLPLVTQENYGWGETYLSIVYMVGGVYLILIFVAMSTLGSKFKVKDQSYVIWALLLTTCSLSLLIMEQIPDSKDLKTRITIFMFICLTTYSAIPLNLVAIKSLVTKLTVRETQGMTQGVYSSISRVALVLGPILASAAFHNRVVFGSVMGILCLTALFVFVLSLRKLRTKIAYVEQYSN